MTTDTDYNEHNDRRSVRRRRTLKEGRIVFGDLRMVIDCVVRDMSERGARLKTASSQGVPDTFWLYLPQARERVRAELRWKTGNELGVEFVGEFEKMPGLMKI